MSVDDTAPPGEDARCPDRDPFGAGRCALADGHRGPHTANPPTTTTLTRPMTAAVPDLREQMARALFASQGHLTSGCDCHDESQDPEAWQDPRCVAVRRGRSGSQADAPALGRRAPMVAHRAPSWSAGSAGSTRTARATDDEDMCAGDGP